jgi:hypothetical protein
VTAQDGKKVAELAPSTGATPLSKQGPAGAGAAPERAAPAIVEPGRLYLEIQYNVDGTMLQGNRDRSFLNEGINHTSQLSFFFNQPVRGTWRLEHLVVGRYTDNPRVDPERNSLQRAYFRLTGPSFEGMLGDSLVNYSRLSFSQNIKGLSTRKDWTRKFRTSGVAGFFVDRWGSLYRDFTAFRDIRLDCQAASLPGAPAVGCIEVPAGSGLFFLSPENPAKPYSRLVGGARAEYKTGRNSWVAVNWSYGDDLHQSLPAATLFCEDTTTAVRTVRKVWEGCLPGETELAGFRLATPEAFRNSVLTGESHFEYEPWGFRVRSEFAYSWSAGGLPPAGATTSNFICALQPPILGASVLDSRCFSGQVGDFAARAEITQKVGKLSWRADYSRFQPDFLSVNARQIRDLQEMVGRGEFAFSRQVTFAGVWRHSSDNLNGRRNFTNRIISPEARLIFRSLPFYRLLSIEVGYRHRMLETRDNPTPQEFRKRITRIPFLSVSLPIRSSQLNFDYEHRRDSDAPRPQLSSDTDRFAFGFRGDYALGEWSFAPFFRMELERLNKNSPNNPDLAPIDPTLVFPADFFDAFDTSRSFQGGFLLEAPKYFRLEGQYREFNSLTASALRVSAALDPLLRTFYLNQGFKRPSWRGALTLKLFNDENKLLTFYYERNNNLFNTGDPFVPDVKSFRETIIGGTALFRFDK